MKLVVVWKTDVNPVDENELLRSLRPFLYNGCDLRARSVEFDWCSPGEYSLAFELDELYANLSEAIISHIRKVYQVEPSVTIIMTLKEAMELEEVVCKRRKTLHAGIRLIRATRSWLKDKRVAEIRHMLEAGEESIPEPIRYRYNR